MHNNIELFEIGKKLMDTSVDHLFKNGDDVFTAGAVAQQPPQPPQDGSDASTPTTSTGVEPNSDKQKTKLVR